MNNNRKKFERTYAFGRNLSCGIVNLTLNPTIINNNVIPKEGPIILCGNHLHVWDQFPVMCATTRPIHWMAKKEYFEGNLSLVFKLMGCIPVDRKKNPKEAKEIAISYLESGEAIGLFPEGTRNQYQVAINEYLKYKKLYEEAIESNSKNKNILLENRIKKLSNICKEKEKNIQNAKEIVVQKGNYVIENEELLPFKFGAVSMAKKTNAIIVPFGVTGDYKLFNDNLMVNFGNPFTVNDMSLEEANEVLRENISSLIKENKSKIKKK